MAYSDVIRDALRRLPNLAATTTGDALDVSTTFFPEAHAEVLDPDVSLVVGNRGMGKSYWALAMADDSLRLEIGKRYQRLRRWRLDGLDVKLGFQNPDGVRSIVGKHELAEAMQHAAPEDIWRAVFIMACESHVKTPIPRGFDELVRWVAANRIGQRELFRDVDELLGRDRRGILVIFDQLEQVADDWADIQALTQGLLRLALTLKSYRNLKVKIFMRPDQAENRELFGFPDASKISGGSRVLTWRSLDLYGLLFFELRREQLGFEALAHYCAEAGVDFMEQHERLSIPNELAVDAPAQGRVFDKIAGPMMGRSTKRGRPYTWIPTHLSDAKGEISPRTFLLALRTAAAAPRSMEQDTAVDFAGIQEGVRTASGRRLAEIQEDYPWVEDALKPLRGVLVPCSEAEVIGHWVTSDAFASINRYAGRNAPIEWSAFTSRSVRDEGAALLRLLAEIGVVEMRDNGKVNVPDIFRVQAGVLRKGGIAPQQRRRL